MIKERLIDYIRDSITGNWDIEALGDYQGKSYSYRDIAGSILKLHMLFREAGIEEGDKIALLGKNSANWCTVYLATVTYGAVTVPILPDFKRDDLMNILNHSDSKMLFVDEKLWETLAYNDLKEISNVIKLESFSYLAGRDEKSKAFNDRLSEAFSEKYPDLKKEDLVFSDIDNEKLAVISYTSGTTGFSKGVMVPHRSLAANVRYAQNNMPLKPGDKIVSFLPLAHTYGCAFEFLFPFTYGCHITILTKTPSPQIIIQAFKEIRPRLILSVPLVIEKVYKKQLIPVISKPAMKVMLAIPGLNSILHKKIRAKLFESFGGNFHEIVIGGAAFNADAEKFFRKIKFPFSVGYGMTECGPLISYASWTTTKLGASGRPVDTLEVTIDSDNPQKEVGEIILRGDNVMLGYYKNPEATDDVIDSDGWMHTGDLGYMDEEGNIFIKGRSKSMLLGPSGKNIYPEEIESMINNQDYVGESVVISEEDKLVALIYPDSEQMKKEGITEEQLPEIYETIRKMLNERLPSYMNVSRFRIHKEEFVKTPKRNVKRFLYTKD
ncbi:MAG: AMP-binding protein [Bacteroidales bacterium]|nr:AMP-binding protein [Bacteroidales bacterium]